MSVAGWAGVTIILLLQQLERKKKTVNLKLNNKVLVVRFYLSMSSSTWHKSSTHFVANPCDVSREPASYGLPIRSHVRILSSWRTIWYIQMYGATHIIVQMKLPASHIWWFGVNDGGENAHVVTTSKSHWQPYDTSTRTNTHTHTHEDGRYRCQRLLSLIHVQLTQTVDQTTARNINLENNKNNRFDFDCAAWNWSHRLIDTHTNTHKHLLHMRLISFERNGHKRLSTKFTDKLVLPFRFCVSFFAVFFRRW